MNARFWTFYRGAWVKITLRPGQVLRCGYSQRDEEGYSYACEAWLYDGQTVYADWEWGGRDCDGPISHTGASYCKQGWLAAVPIEEPRPEDHHAGKPIYRPMWCERKPTRVHDEYAEAMNY